MSAVMRNSVSSLGCGQAPYRRLGRSVMEIQGLVGAQQRRLLALYPHVGDVMQVMGVSVVGGLSDVHNRLGKSTGLISSRMGKEEFDGRSRSKHGQVDESTSSATSAPLALQFADGCCEGPGCRISAHWTATTPLVVLPSCPVGCLPGFGPPRRVHDAIRGPSSVPTLQSLTRINQRLQRQHHPHHDF